MRALVVYCHPVEGSFSSVLRDAAVRGLTAAGHKVDLIDLAARGFDPVMPAEEWQTHSTADAPHPHGLSGDVELVRNAEVIVFVYPTWWSSVPAQLKGWVERVMLPGTAYRLDERNRVRPNLGQLRRLVTVTTFGSPRIYTMLMNDNGARLLLRSLRMVSTRRTRTLRLALFRMDRTTEESRRSFVEHVERRMASL